MDGAGNGFAHQLRIGEGHDGFLSLFTGPTGTRLKIAASATIVAQGDRVDTIYRIVSGHARCSLYTEDGHRRIVSFRGAGDIVGMSQMATGHWNASLEAVTSCVVEAAPRRLIADRIMNDPDVMQGALKTLQDEIDLQDSHVLMMSILPASARVHAFLEAFAEGRGGDGFVALPMCRRDIGEYLGLSMETVSRSFTALRDSHRIETMGAEKFRVLVHGPAEASLGSRRAA